MKKLALGMMIVASSVVIYGCSDSKDTADKAVQEEAATMTMGDAQQQAEKELPDATITDLEATEEKGMTLYKVKMTSTDAEYELLYDAKTGSLLKKEEKRLDKKDNGDVTVTTGDFTITEDKAKEIALEKVPGAEITKFEMDASDVEYEIKLQKDNKKYEIEIDANSGDIKKYEEKDKK